MQGPYYYFGNMDLGCVLFFLLLLVADVVIWLHLGNAVWGTQRPYRVLCSIAVKYNSNTCFCVTSMMSLLQSPKLVTL